MLVTNHVLSGAVIGAVTRHPASAFLLGAASHFALDAVPHWGKFGNRQRMLRVAVPDGLTGLAAMAVMAVVAPPERRAAVVAGMSGAAFPDLDKPWIIFFGRSPFPRAVDHFHRCVQREAPRRWHYEAVAALAFGMSALAAFRGRPRPGYRGPAPALEAAQRQPGDE